MRKASQNLDGLSFGRLSVLSKKGNAKSGDILYECVCLCGTKKTVTASNLRKSRIKSCGCLQIDRLREVRKKHGMTGSPTYNTWAKMRYRCTKKNDKSYERYGGRGIKVCDRWNEFGNFLEDMGEKPPGMSIDRIDNNGDYTPENCRWASDKVQCRNRRSNRMIVFNNEEKPLIEWAEHLKISYAVLHNRIYALKWDIEKAFTTEVIH